jgi:PAS domain-containing protein
MFSGFVSWWNKLMLSLVPEYQILSDKLESSGRALNRIEKMLDNEKEAIEQEITLYKSMLGTIGNTIPDMLWAKDLDGKYLYANKAIQEGLLFDSDPIGKDDMQMSREAKKRFGPENHTFGEVCGNSDIVVLQKQENQRFLEHGLVKGTMLYLEVFKAPLYVDGILVGVCGTGRDLTEYVTAYRVHDCSGCGKMSDIFTKFEFGDKIDG